MTETFVFVFLPVLPTPIAVYGGRYQNGRHDSLGRINQSGALECRAIEKNPKQRRPLRVDCATSVLIKLGDNFLIFSPESRSSGIVKSLEGAPSKRLHLERFESGAIKDFRVNRNQWEPAGWAGSRSAIR